jgi:hypothetical protein
MRKTFALIFVLLMAVGVFGRGSLEVWVGGEMTGSTWNDVMTVSPDKWVDLPVYLQGTDDSVFVADLNFSVGVNWPYVDSIAAGDLFFPFGPTMGAGDRWDIHDFTNFNTPAGGGPAGPTPANYYSLSFVGFARPVNDDSPWFPANPPITYPYDPVLGFSFQIHTAPDTLNIGDTICFSDDADPTNDAIAPGHDYVVGPSNAGDTLGGAGYGLIQNFACLYYSPNQPPEIVGLTGGEACGECPSYTLEIFDNDGDDLDVTAFVGLEEVEVIFVSRVGDTGFPTTYYYHLQWCGDPLAGDMVVTVSDGINDPATEATFPVDFLGVDGMIAADLEDDVEIWPGEEEWMEVTLDQCDYSCFCLGGFVFTICFDASVLQVTETAPGDMLEFGEYWNATVDNVNGTVHFVFINELGDCEDDTCDAVDICDWTGPVAKIKFLLDGDITYPGGFCIPVCFCPPFGGEDVVCEDESEVSEYDYLYNNVSDKDGLAYLPSAVTRFRTRSMPIICTSISIVATLRFSTSIT